MKKIVTKVFDKIWVDCQIRNYMTMLINIDPSFDLICLNNSYTYSIQGQSGWYKALYADSNEIYNEIYQRITTENIYFNSSSIISELIQCIDEKQFVSVLVDLFYWGENNLLYGLKHNTHYAMLIGYDCENGTLLFDENNGNNSILEISYENFYKAMVIEENEVVLGLKHSIINKHCNMNLYNIKIDSLCKNAQTLIKNINRIMYSTYWDIFGNGDEIDLLVTASNIFFNRQKSTQYLFEYLKQTEQIEKKHYEIINQYIIKCISKCDVLKNLLTKYSINISSYDFERINKLTDQVLECEKKLWENFLVLMGVDIDNYKQKLGVKLKNKKVNFYFREIPFDKGICLKSITCMLDQSSKYYTDIKLAFYNFKGKWGKTGDCKSFSLRSKGVYKHNIDYIVDTIYKGDGIYLKTTMPFTDVYDLDNFYLSYECKEDTSIIADERGVPLEQFYNEAVIADKNITPYINKCFLSNAFKMDTKLKKIDYPINVKYCYEQFPDYFCSFKSKINSYEKQYVYLRYLFDSSYKRNIKIYLGHTGGIKVWCNKKTIAILKSKNGDCEINDEEYIVNCTFINGVNEIIIAAMVNHEKDYRIKIRLECISDQKFDLPTYVIGDK